jgi:hypothetical protein
LPYLDGCLDDPSSTPGIPPDGRCGWDAVRNAEATVEGEHVFCCCGALFASDKRDRLMNTIRFLVAMTAVGALAQDSPTADPFKLLADYDAAEKAIQAEIQPQLDDLKTRCETSLTAMAEKLNQAKRADLAEGLKREIKRFQKHGQALSSTKDAPVEARTAYADYARGAQAAEQSVALKRASQRTKFAQELAAAERAATTRGDAAAVALLRRARASLVVRQAVAQRAYVPSDLFGKREGGEWQEVPAEGGVLVGFRAQKGGWFQFDVVKGLEPVFMTSSGMIRGTKRGSGSLDQEAIAKDGYAVGGILVWSGEVVDSMQAIFMKLKPDGLSLDPQDSYISGMLGRPPGKGKPRELNGKGKLAIGIYGAAGDTVENIGLIFVK